MDIKQFKFMVTQANIFLFFEGNISGLWYEMRYHPSKRSSVCIVHFQCHSVLQCSHRLPASAAQAYAWIAYWEKKSRRAGFFRSANIDVCRPLSLLEHLTIQEVIFYLQIWQIYWQWTYHRRKWEFSIENKDRLLWDMQQCPIYIRPNAVRKTPEVYCLSQHKFLFVQMWVLENYYFISDNILTIPGIFIFPDAPINFSLATTNQIRLYLWETE